MVIVKGPPVFAFACQFWAVSSMTLTHASDDGTMEQLGAGGMPLGIMPNAPYRAGKTQLQPGDALVIYSDGVTETQNQQGEEFGPVRLYDVVARNLDATASGIRDKIEAALTKFAQGTASVDDITLVIVKRQAEGVMVASSRG